MNAKHGEQGPAEGIHVPYNWSFQDAAERNAVTGLTADDFGKIAIQRDTNMLYMLVDPLVPTWTMLTLDYDYYVASITQAGTDAPVDSVFGNTLPVNSWTRLGVGEYRKVVGGGDRTSRVWLAGMSNWSSGTAGIPLLSQFAELAGYCSMFPAFDNGETSVDIMIYDTVLELRDLNELIGGSVLYLPEIRIYH